MGGNSFSAEAYAAAGQIVGPGEIGGQGGEPLSPPKAMNELAAESERLGLYVNDAARPPAAEVVRVTDADVESMIAMELYSRVGVGNGWRTGAMADSASLINASRMTVCALVLKTGFTVLGYDACVSLENFDAELGRKYAREDAVRKLWKYAGFDLIRRLNSPASA